MMEPAATKRAGKDYIEAEERSNMASCSNVPAQTIADSFRRISEVGVHCAGIESTSRVRLQSIKRYTGILAKEAKGSILHIPKD